MNQLPSSTSAVRSPIALRPDTVDERTFGALNDLAGRPTIDLRHAPTAEQCHRVAAMVPMLLAGNVAWQEAAAHATRLVSVLPAGKSDDMDKALAITELAKAFSAYPPAVAAWGADRLMETRRFRPVPADVHETCKARTVHLAAAAALADRVLTARREAEERRAADEAERRAEAEARAAGIETPSERRARIAAEAMNLTKQLRESSAA